MSGRSREVSSRQSEPHPRLAEVLERHRATRWKQPLHPPTIAAFRALERQLAPGEHERLVLDSGCGTGDSTRALARLHPDSVVIGVDRSAARLARTGVGAEPLRQDNCLWVRAELASFWRLALAAGWRPRVHYLLYPNPWPKPGQLQRRWHGHPVFPDLVALGGRLVMRTNWAVYAQEFAFALGRARGRDVAVDKLARPDGLTPFERKYRDSGHCLYEVSDG
ncbi:SAM-dependent methyltransferase [Marinihelvus fidelis]|uniref:tRNA (guanine(46)-N(7))-methyltransferase n=2 Tax=Marinihelvus fidelis TaxID=2613842 RepID=A0A5N0T6B7_9GAMM|nr:SAM-dependent methyltransferase [Marinihelvus fidelis]